MRWSVHGSDRGCGHEDSTWSMAQLDRCHDCEDAVPDIPEEACSEVLFRVKDSDATMDGVIAGMQALKGVLIQLGKVKVTRKLDATVEIAIKSKASTVMVAELHKLWSRMKSGLHSPPCTGSRVCS